jgi:aspartate racemase
LGILKAGGAYVPLDPEYPPARIDLLMQDAGVRIVLTQSHLHDRVPAGARRVPLDRPGEWTGSGKSEQPNSGSLAYIMYTSGSTGEPKGVEVPHRAIVRLVSNTNYAHLGENEVFLHVAPLAFDASTFEIWGALLHGARVVLYPERRPSVEELKDVLAANGVTILFLTTSLFNLIIDVAPEILRPIRQLLTGGEAISLPHVHRALAALPGTEIIHVYGPTENTTFSTFYSIPAVLSADAGPPPLGRPIANTTVYILDRAGRPVPPGVPGELHTGGDGLARGYLKRPELTEQKFIPDPFTGGPEAHLYRTGDLARYLPDGNIEYLGRMDDQVKVRGFRVEVGEIETALARHPAVRQCAVTAPKDSTGTRRLVAYVTAREKAADLTAELRAMLQQQLPDYMVPSVIVVLDSMPLSPNGKVERKLLPAPESQPQAEDAGELSDSFELRLAAIWEAVIGIKGIGRTSDFFDSGGHSLSAARMLAEVENVFGARLPLVAVFQAPRLNQMARLIRQDNAGKNPPPLLCPIQREGDLPPLFCVSPPGVNALGYIFLARKLGSRHPVYGLQADPEIHPNTLLDHTAKAAESIAEMRKVQPHGPYFLAGTCQGAHIAFEMTRQLERAGERVGAIAVLDAWVEENTRNRMLFFLRTTWIRLQKLLAAKRRSDAPPQSSATPRRTPPKANRAVLQEMMKRYFPGRDYVAPQCDAPIVVFRQPRQPFFRVRDRSLGWHRRTRAQVQVVDIPGAHQTILRDPAVSVIAEALKPFLRVPGASPNGRPERQS